MYGMKRQLDDYQGEVSMLNQCLTELHDDFYNVLPHVHISVLMDVLQLSEETPQVTIPLYTEFCVPAK